MKDSAVNFIVIASPFATLKMKPNVNPAKVIIEKDRIRIMNTLFNLKLQAPDKEVAALLKRKPPYAIFFSTFPEKLNLREHQIILKPCLERLMTISFSN